jgi:hypothetical protein
LQDQALAASIVHVVVAGNLLWAEADDDDRATTSTVRVCTFSPSTLARAPPYRATR